LLGKVGKKNKHSPSNIYTKNMQRANIWMCCPQAEKENLALNNLNVWKTSGDPFCSYGQGSRPSSSFGRKAQKCLESTSYKSKASHKN
jgi:hypothetical protein